MAVATVSWQGTRVSNADTLTAGGTWTGLGSGISATVETEFFYQGAACISCKIKTSEASLYLTPTTTVDMSTTPSAWMGKMQQVNKNVIDANGMQLRMGTSTTAYYRYDIANSTTYPVRGGFLIVPIDPNIAQWRSTTIGSPTGPSAIDYFAGASDASVQAKAENFGIDAIDVIPVGEGLVLTRGDSADPDATFQDFVDVDEGTADNRWGHVITQDGILYVAGVLTIGNSTVNTSFTDSNKVLVFPDTRTSNGFSGVDFNLEDADNVIDISACIFNGVGDLYTSDDTRPVYEAIGTAGTLTIADTTFNNFADITLTSNCILDGCSLLSGQNINQVGANIYSCTIVEAATAPGAAVIISDNVTRVALCNFTQSSNGGHAIEGTTVGTYTWTSSLSGYGANGSTNAAFLNTSGGLITLNLGSVGDEPTITNSGAGSDTNVVSSATITVTNMYTESQVAIVDRTLNQTIATNESTNGSVVSVSVSAGGAGYNNTDTLTVSGGTGTAATLSISTDGSGVIQSAGILTGGEYSVAPTNPVSTSGGSGTSAEFNLNVRGTFEYTYGGTPTYDIVVFSLDYKEVRFSDFDFPATDSSLFISQTIDRVFENP